MKLSTIYRRAAEIMAHPAYDYGCCGATWRATDGQTAANFDRAPGKGRDDTKAHFCKWFCEDENRSFWWDFPPLDREPRILALLLAAELAQSEGL